LTGTLQLLLITAWEANAESVCPGHDNPNTKLTMTKVTMSDVLYSLLPSHESLYKFGQERRWRLSKMLRNHVVRNCILMELAARTRAGYLPLFKIQAAWSQEATVTSQWVQATQRVQVVPQENLAAFAWLQPGDDQRAIDCRDLVHSTIVCGLGHHAARIECSLLREDGCVLDGQRAVLENIDLASAMKYDPEGVLILPIGTLRLPKPMENYLWIVKSIGKQHCRTQGLAPPVGEAATESDDDSLMDLTTGEAAGQCSKDAMISELKRQLAATLEIAKQLMTVKELQELQLMLHHTKQGSSALTLHPSRMDAPSTVLGAEDRQAAIPPPTRTEETGCCPT
jgi:hypothetical protein